MRYPNVYFRLATIMDEPLCKGPETVQWGIFTWPLCAGILGLQNPVCDGGYVGLILFLDVDSCLGCVLDMAWNCIAYAIGGGMRSSRLDRYHSVLSVGWLSYSRLTLNILVCSMLVAGKLCKSSLPAAHLTLPTEARWRLSALLSCI